MNSPAARRAPRRKHASAKVPGWTPSSVMRCRQPTPRRRSRHYYGPGSTTGLRDKKRWSLPWYSSFGTDFNYDFGVTIDESIAPGQYNFRTKAEFEAMGSDFFESEQPFEMPGRSCFLHVDGRVFHTYSQYARGLESTGGSYYFLDLTALGRQEEWEEPKGRSDDVRSATPNFAR